MSEAEALSADLSRRPGAHHVLPVLPHSDKVEQMRREPRDPAHDPARDPSAAHGPESPPADAPGMPASPTTAGTPPVRPAERLNP